MQLTKTDCLSILAKIQEDQLIGADSTTINKYIKKLLLSTEDTIPTEILKFISKNKGFDVANFYEMLRIKHNKNKSPLYTNILKEITDIYDVVTTLTCLLTQIVLYGKKLANPSTFYLDARADEIARSLMEFFKEEYSDNCIKLLKVIKSDILVLEYLKDKRELAKND